MHPKILNIKPSPLGTANHAGRSWGGKQVNRQCEPHQLPRNSKKWRPRPGSKTFTNGGRAPKVDQVYQKYDAERGKYIYAASIPRGAKGWTKV